IVSDFEAKLGTYFSPGDELLTIGDKDSIQATALVKQEDIRWIGNEDHSQVEILVWGDGDKDFVTGTVLRCNPRARDDLPHDAFAASNGGPLAVVPRQQVEGAKDSEDASMMLTQPRVPIEIALSKEDQQRILAGQSGLLMMRGRQEKMAGYLVERVMRFARRNNVRTHGL
ncbi:HlyD family secretion protein, partial [Mariniblastus sp.]|nr:HlyD family secretion protein [Mariniblastus sp.]